MKKIFFISVSLAIILLVLFLSGAIDFSTSVRDSALAEGNRLMKAGRYQEAFEAYERGLKENPQDPELNYNSGQALYNMGEYSHAAEYYERSSLRTPDRYLNMGNCRLKQNDYRRAAEFYRQGILEFPQDVPLKYNYEYALEQIKQMEQLDGEDEGEQSDSEAGEGKQSGDEGDEGEQGDGEGSQSEQNGGQGEQRDGEDESKQGGEDNQSGEDEQGGEGGQDDEVGQSAGIVQGGHDDDAAKRQARSVIENALEALEKQEADSLKNNRSRNHIYEEGDYEW